MSKLVFESKWTHLITLDGDLMAEVVGTETGRLQVGNVALPWTLGQDGRTEYCE